MYMTNFKFSNKDNQHFFAKTIDGVIQASFSNAQGRKNYHIPKSEKVIEEPPIAIESFTIEPEQYRALMERINSLYD